LLHDVRITHLVTENNTKRREKAKKSGGISNNNAKIPTYHDKEIRDLCLVARISYGFRIRCGMTGREIAAAFGPAMTSIEYPVSRIDYFSVPFSGYSSVLSVAK